MIQMPIILDPPSTLYSVLDIQFEVPYYPPPILGYKQGPGALGRRAACFSFAAILDARFLKRSTSSLWPQNYAACLKMRDFAKHRRPDATSKRCCLKQYVHRGGLTIPLTLPPDTQLAADSIFSCYLLSYRVGANFICIPNMDRPKPMKFNNVPT